MSFAFQQQRAMKYETFIDFSDENDCISEYVSRSSASFQGDRGVPGLRGERVWNLHPLHPVSVEILKSLHLHITKTKQFAWCIYLFIYLLPKSFFFFFLFLTWLHKWIPSCRGAHFRFKDLVGSRAPKGTRWDHLYCVGLSSVEKQIKLCLKYFQCVFNSTEQFMAHFRVCRPLV